MSLFELPSRGTIQVLVSSSLLLLGFNIYLNYRRALKSIGNHPGLRLIFSGFIGNVLPRYPGVSIGRHWGMVRKHEPYAQAGWDIFSIVAIYPKVAAYYMVADPLAIKEITLHRSRFPKPVEDYTVISFFGQNILITEAEEWKKHRKIAAPTFSEKNNTLVWDESIRIMLEIFDSWGEDESEIVINHVVDITLPVALLIIGVAGFGRRVSWKEDTLIPPGHTMSFKEALHTVSTYIQLKVIVPKFAYRFSKLLQQVQRANDELQDPNGKMYLQEMVNARKLSLVKEERYDLFSALLEGNELGKDDAKLTDQELIGNIFIFLVAGHETTAHALAFLFGLLALEQDEQEKLYQHIKSVVPNGKLPSYEHINSLNYVMAVFNESLRLFPPVAYIPKVSAEDTTLPAVCPDGSVGSVVVPKGTKLTLNTTGLHYNPRYWPDPFEFKPSRFVGDYSKDAFLPFSAGARACLGRRFAETESVAIISMLVSRYKIELRYPEQYEGLTSLEKREKLLASRPGLTITPLSIPLVFKKRSSIP